MIPGSGRSPGEGSGSSLQDSCLENPMNQGAWWATVPRATKSDMTESLTLFGKLRTANRGRALPLNEEGGNTVSGQRRLIEVLKLEFLLSCVQRRKL